MNILQAHDLVKFWIDEYGSPRQNAYDIDQALWSASKAIVEEKHDYAKQNHMLDTVEGSQRVRDELYTITKQTDLGASAVAVSSDIIAVTDIPESYKYLLLLQVVALGAGNPDVNTEWEILESVTADKKRDFLSRNPYRIPKSGTFQRGYYEQNAAGFRIHSATANINFALITYLAEPVENYIGQEKAAGYIHPTNVSAIAMGDVIHDGTDYSRGDEFVLQASTAFTGDNILILYTNLELPITLHEEIAKKAAIFILDRSNMFDKARAMERDIMAK